MAISATDVQKAYLAYFGRPADPTGLAFWETQAAETMYASFAGSDEYKNMYASMTNAQIVNQVYKNIFGRESDSAGLLYWTNQLDSQAVTIDNVVQYMLNAASGVDATTIANRLTYCDDFTKALDTGAEIAGYAGSAAATAARNAMYPITDAASLATAEANLPATVAAVVAIGSGTTTPQNYTLTTGQDIINGDGSNMTIRGVAGQIVGQQDQTTLNSSDIITDAFTTDNDVLVLNMTGTVYNGGATIKNIETLQIGTDLTQAVTFDMNVNQGSYEVTGTNFLTYDQITTGESLRVLNVVPVASGSVAPELIWSNEAGSAAGTIGTTYRQATIAGTADNQSVTLMNVNATTNPGTADGTLLIAGGMEKITLTSSGTTANTLNNVQDLTGAGGIYNGTLYADTGANNSWADILSSGSLTTVTLKGSSAIGKVGTVVTQATDGNYGLTNRLYRTGAADGDLGVSNARSSAANLLSVGARVTSVDASAMTADTAVRFTAKTDGTATNVTFAGGSGRDYVEFELGNVNALGNGGNDTFAFINTSANSTFGEGDSLVGGDGNDTIQLGVNGVGTYVIGQTELRNKTSIGTLDLRGQTNTVTLSSEFLANADTANSMTIHTDRIVQTSDTDASNPLNGANNGLETNSVTTTNLTMLTSSQGVTYVGGSGSDRLILNDATFNILQTINGGDYSDTAVIGAGRYDTITLVTNGESVVIDGQDLSNVSNVEGLVLTKNSASASYNITMTQTFLNNNTKATDAANTSINDTIFQIDTSAAANQSALAGGDTVTIDVRDLLNATDTARATGFTTRQFDVTSLTNAGVNVVFVGNTGNLTLVQVQALGIVCATGADANFTDVINSAAVPAGNTGITFVSSAVGAQAVLGTNLNDTFTLSQADTVTGGAGADTVTLNAGAEAALVTLGATADTVTLNNIFTGTLAMGAGGTLTVGTDLGAAYDMNAAATYTFTGATALTFTANQTGVTLEDGNNVTATATAGGTFTLGTGGQAITANGTAAYGITDSTGADTITVGSTATTTTITNSNGAANGADTFNLNAGIVAVGYDHAAFQGGINADTITGFTAGTSGDILAFKDGVTLSLAGVATKSFVSGTAAVAGAQMVDANNVNIGVVTGVGYANYAAVESALKGAGGTESEGQIIVYFNQTNNAVQVEYDSTGIVAAGGNTLLATFSGMSLADLSNLNTNNFTVA